MMRESFCLCVCLLRNKKPFISSIYRYYFIFFFFFISIPKWKGRRETSRLCPEWQCFSLWETADWLVWHVRYRQQMNDYWQHHVLFLKLHKWRAPLFCPWWDWWRRGVTVGVGGQRMWNSQICWSAPSKCRCIDFDHGSFPHGCLCMPYPKQHSQDQGLVGVSLPHESFPAPLGGGGKADDQHGVTKIKPAMGNMHGRGRL